MHFDFLKLSLLVFRIRRLNTIVDIIQINCKKTSWTVVFLINIYIFCHYSINTNEWQNLTLIYLISSSCIIIEILLIFNINENTKTQTNMKLDIPKYV